MAKPNVGVFLVLAVLLALGTSTTRARAGEASECDRRCNVDYGGGGCNVEQQKEERACYEACLAEDD